MDGVYNASSRSNARRKRQGGIGRSAVTLNGSGRGGKAGKNVANGRAAAAASGDLAAAYSLGSGARPRRRFFSTDNPLQFSVVNGNRLVVNGNPKVNSVANGDDHGLNGLGSRSRFGSPMSVI
jgi:hypothetical protein